MNDEIKSHMNTRDKLFRKWRKSRTSTNKENYRQMRSLVNIMVRSAKEEHTKQLLRDFSNDSNKFWKCIKNVFPSSNKSTQKHHAFTVDGIDTDNKAKIANGFCSYFVTVIKYMESNAFKLRDFVWKSQTHLLPKTVRRLKFQYVSKIEVERDKKMKRKKTTGSDNLPAGMLKDSASTISSPLSFIINLSLRQGMVPSEWKVASVTPIHKAGPKNEFENYRPISVLSILSKVLERIVHKQLLTHLETENLLSSCQYGFRPGRSTQLATTKFIDSVRRTVDKGLIVGSIFIDLSKAFDTLSHSKLLTKLSAYGVRDVELQWFTDYLFNRKVFVN